jgi:sec-independent protein translocase protein TatA
MIGDILQPTHLLFLLIVALLVLGPKRLPEVGRSVGKSIREFKGGLAGVQDDANVVTPQHALGQSYPPDPATQPFVAAPTAPGAALGETVPSAPPVGAGSAALPTLQSDATPVLDEGAGGGVGPY